MAKAIRVVLQILIFGGLFVGDLVGYRELGKTLTDTLRLQCFPLAVRLVKGEGEFPEGTRRPSLLNMRVTMCQGFAMSRRIGWTVGLTVEDMKCVPNLIAYGFAELEDPRVFLEAFRAMNYYETDEIAEKALSTMPTLEPGKYRGIAISPLAWTKIEPDLVMAYCNSAQAMRLIQATVYKTGERITTPLSGLGASCLEGVLRTFLTKKPGLVIPGAGDRVFGTTQDDEVIFTMPKEMILDIVSSLKKAGYEKGVRYPLPVSIMEPMMVPDAWMMLNEKLKRKIL
jgi:uncharacterized protein (DUF169 family)